MYYLILLGETVYTSNGQFEYKHISVYVLENRFMLANMAVNDIAYMAWWWGHLDGFVIFFYNKRLYNTICIFHIYM